eukprot:CAMPEP_0180286908 /NCGR_PEP_ID=MMETSP0988-20121125/12957_1 /TAXON_ID=697907 /ORGANISM="non described non described, Strain CCMP2293" /LENGTH=236 /DNA_ID=CAMNT_0022260933 /DNA_START=708 /DNA_END=1418 /DNA_ORIENTATION=+
MTRGGGEALGIAEVPGEHTHLRPRGRDAGHFLVPVHHERRVREFRTRGEVHPDLEETERVRAILVDKWKHFAVDDSCASCHPLQISVTVPSRVTLGVGVVDEALGGGRERLEAAVGVLREARDPFAMVHAVRLAPVEVSTVPLARRLHLLITRRVVISVVDAEEEGIRRLERESEGPDLLDRIHHVERGERPDLGRKACRESACVWHEGLEAEEVGREDAASQGKPRAGGTERRDR